MFMNEYFNSDIVKILGLIIISVAFVSVIISIAAAVLYRRKNDLISKSFAEIAKKETFELLTPVILKRIESVTKIVEEKQNVASLVEESKPLNGKTEIADEIESSETEPEKEKLESEKNLDENESELRDVSERYKIDNRFLRDPNRS
jgi:flagellar motility protein MotE (MotC chaperone)